MLDTFGRNIDYIRISLTDKCNLRCIYCMPDFTNVDKQLSTNCEALLSDKESFSLSSNEIIKILKSVVLLGIKKVRYTGGEPLVFQGIEKLINETSKIHRIQDISITTNGILLNDKALDLKKAGLKRVNISLDTLKKDRYKEITRVGDIDSVFKAINTCLNIGLTPVKLNTVIIKGINDDEIEDFINLTKELPVHVRFIELMPIGQGVKFYKNGFISSSEIVKMYPELVFLGRKKGETADIYKLKNSKGTIQFISPIDCKFCSDCNRIRLTSKGTIKPCLHSENEANIKQYLYNDEFLRAAIKNAITNKPLEHKLEVDNKSKCSKGMFEIGG